MTDDPEPRKKPSHVSSNQTVGNFSQFAVHKTTKSVHPPRVWRSFATVPTGPPAPPPGPHSMPAIPCGLYEVDEPGGSTVPIRVRRRADTSKFAPDQWVMEWLLGADGRTWEAFAFVRPDRLEVWKRFVKTDYGMVADRLYKHLAGGECFDGWEFRLAKPCCARCGRELKKDEDKTAGAHAGCLEKWGHDDG
jgi:hypothetical protein